MNQNLSIQIASSLKRISANDLQVLAEEMACVKFPGRFRVGTLVSRGRNEDGQTTKNWPDAYVSTGVGAIDGIEATRQLDWSAHLDDDLAKASNSINDKLSGYFFIGGQPEQKPSDKDLTKYIDAFAQLGIARDRITILVGRDLVRELEGAEYARIRQERLGRARICRELERPFSGRAKKAARSICLLGGYAALGGQIENLPRPTFKDPYTADDLLVDLSQKRQTDELGMYQLQFWYGLMTLYREGGGPETIRADFGDRFVRQLSAAEPPTEWAKRHQSSLLSWLSARKADYWRLKGDR